MVRTYRFAGAILFFVSLLTVLGSASTVVPAVTITLNSSIQSPQLLNTDIRWYADVHNGQQGHIYDYRYTVTLENQSQIVRDFQADNSFVWAPYMVEGTYQISVVVRDITNVPYTVYPAVSQQFVILPYVTTQGGSAVHATSHPLVALFSGPPCKSGDFIQVRFRQSGSNVSSVTNTVPCSTKSANFYVAGMLPSTQYLMHWEEVGPNFSQQGEDLSFTTGAVAADYPPTQFQVNVPPQQHDTQFPVLLWHLLRGANGYRWTTATDLAGNIIWYKVGQVTAVRMQPGGTMLAFPGAYAFSEFDLVGHEILRTTVTRINEQLVARGMRPLDSFNTHEGRRLPNGNFLLLGGDHLVSTKYQGGTEENPICILSDVVLVLDRNLQLIWAWDAIDHQDLNRKATQGEVCMQGGGGCPAFPENFAQANDWLHSNAAQLTSDGNIIVSERNQDWVLKINYNNGQGDGSVIWKMGPFGDFTITNPPHTQCGNPKIYPWFTHQHDSAFQAQGTGPQLGQSVFTVFDDGNVRVASCGGVGNSRGMVLTVNEPNRKVTIVTQADLGEYSGALGSADLLVGSGIYSSYGNGDLGTTESPFAQSTEVDLSGKIVFQTQVDAFSYRTYRRRDMYTPTLP